MAYLYELLTHQTFQQLCQSVLAKAFPGTQAFPIGQADGGRDAADWSEARVFQVKWSQNPDRIEDPVRWLIGALNSEHSNIELLKQKGVREYELLTNVSGTSPAGSGERDRLRKALTELDWLDGVTVRCWWRETIDSHLENNLEVQWAYPQMLAGPQAMRLILNSLAGAESDRRDRAVKSFLVAQYADEARLRFKQVGLEGVEISDLFVDVHAVPTRPAFVESSSAWNKMISRPKVADLGARDRSSLSGEDVDDSAVGAAALLTSRSPVNRLLVNGGPGQGKSTLLQYVCQFFRARLLDRDLAGFTEQVRAGGQRLPLKIDLKEYAHWRRSRVSNDGSASGSVEQYLASRVNAVSGGQRFDVDDLLAVLGRVPSMIALDGLDEIAMPRERGDTVTEIIYMGERLSQSCPSAMIVITSRPEVDSTIPTFPEHIYLGLTLASLSIANADTYARKWAAVQPINEPEREEILEAWKQKRRDRHVRELSRNPMQLSILLHLIKAKGSSLPDRRTLLYDEYVSLLIEREGEKDRRVANNRDALLEAHGYLAFYLHGEAERTGDVGTIHENNLRSLLRSHLERQGRDSSVNDLFAGVQRVVAIVQNRHGLYEFEVQPLREYFAGRYLYDTAPYVAAGVSRSGQKHDRLFALMARPYWFNVLRFFAGCFSPGELAGLVDLITESAAVIGEGSAGSARTLAATLVGDQLFTDRPSSERRAVAFSFDAIGLRLISGSSIEEPSVRGAAGTNEITDHLLREAMKDASFAHLLSPFVIRRFASGRSFAEAWHRLVEGAQLDERGRWLRILRETDLLSYMGKDMRLATVRVSQELGDPTVSALCGYAGAGSSDPISWARELMDLPGLRIPLVRRQAEIEALLMIFNPMRLADPSFERRERRAVKDFLGPFRRTTSPGFRKIWDSIEAAFELMPMFPQRVQVAEWMDRNFKGTFLARKIGLSASLGVRSIGNEDALPTSGLVADLRHRRSDLQWWEAQITASSQPADLAFWVLAALLMVGPSPLYRLSERLEIVLQDLPDIWLEEIGSSVTQLSRGAQPLHDDEMGGISLSHAPLTALMATARITPSISNRVVREAEQSIARVVGELPDVRFLQRSAARVLLARAGRVFSDEIKGERQRVELEPFRRLKHKFALPRMDRPRGLRLDSNIAKEILSQAGEWPNEIVATALSSLPYAESGPLMSRAVEESWFYEETHPSARR